MIAAYVPAIATPLAELDALVATRDCYARLAGAPPSRATLAILVAQCALETGRWRHCWNHNWGNVKAGAAYDGVFTAYQCNEKLADGWHWYLPAGEVDGGYGGAPRGPVFAVPPAHPQTRFRAHASALEGCAAHLRFLWGTRYRVALDAMVRGEAYAAVMALHRAGYFTATVEPYARAVVSLTREYASAIDAHGVLAVVPGPAPLWPDELEPARSAMTDADLEERVTEFLVPDSMARLNAEFWTGEFYRARDEAVRNG